MPAELVAELGAAYLCADLGITPEPREDHSAYLAHWIALWYPTYGRGR